MEGWRAASWAEAAAVAGVVGATARRRVAVARGREAAAGEAVLAALTETTQ